MYHNTQGSQKQGIPAERAIVLVNAIIDRMLNDAGGHAREVIGDLLDVGFTKEELVETFRFTESDVGGCLTGATDNKEA